MTKSSLYFTQETKRLYSLSIETAYEVVEFGKVDYGVAVCSVICRILLQVVSCRSFQARSRAILFLVLNNPVQSSGAIHILTIAVVFEKLVSQAFIYLVKY